MLRLKDKVAVITGAASGIGLAATRLFAREGARVLALDLDETALKTAYQPEVLFRASSEPASAGRGDREREAPVVPFVADVTKEDHVAQAMATAAELLGGIDIVLPNAGIFGRHALIQDCPLDEFERVLRVNVTGVVATIKHAVPHLICRGGGSIVITSSVGAVVGNPGSVAYAASKHALTAVMKVAAAELAPFGIRVNTVNPGLVDTPMIHALEHDLAPGDPERGKTILQEATLLKRYVQPEEVAELMLFLAADTGSFCTGAMYMIDGGMQYCLQHR